MQKENIVVKKNTYCPLALEVLSRSTAYFPSPLAGEGGRSPDEGLSLNNNRFGEGGTQCRVRGKEHKARRVYTLSSVLGARSTTRGFTLIELLVIVLIIGILAAVAVPQYQKAVAKARVQEGYVNLLSLYQAQNIYHLANDSYTSNIEDLDVSVNDNESFLYRCFTIGYCAAYPQFPNYPIFDASMTEKSIYCRTTTDNSFGLSLCESLGGKKSQKSGDVQYYKLN